MQKELLKNYFLGRLDSNECERVEFRIFEEESFEETLIIAENSLIEDYLENNLTISEVASFNSNFLVSEERLKKVEFIRFLKGYAKKTINLGEEKPTFFERIKAIVFQPKFSFGFASIILLALFGLGYFIFYGSQNPNDQQFLALNNQDLSDLGKFETLRSLSLYSDNPRSIGQSSFLKQNELTENILFRLNLPSSVKSQQNFSTTITRENEVILVIPNSKLQNQEIRLLLPKSSLKLGDYRITLNSDSEKYSFYFSIQ